MCCTFEEYHRCQTCYKIWNRQSHHMSCINQRCRRTLAPRATLPLVNQDTCLPCKIQTRERWQKKSLKALKERERKPTKPSPKTIPVPRRPGLMLTKKLTPLFWDAERIGFCGIWAAEDPTLRKYMEREKTPEGMKREADSC